MLLKERSSDSSDLRCERFSIFSMMLLSSCSFVNESKPTRLSIFKRFCEGERRLGKVREGEE